MEVKLFCIFAEMKFLCTICVHSFKDPRHPLTSTFMTIRHRNLRRFQCIVKQFINLLSPTFNLVFISVAQWALLRSTNRVWILQGLLFSWRAVKLKKLIFPQINFFVVFKSNTCWKSRSFSNLKEWACMQNFF